MAYHYTAADLISAIEASMDNQTISNADRIFLLKNMADILDKINEPVRAAGENITFNSIDNRIIVNTPQYESRYHTNGQLYSETWGPAGTHRDDDKPASVWYHQNGKLELEEYYKNGVHTRADDKPATVTYYENGTISLEEWFKDGKQHRDGHKPASISYNRGGDINVKEHWVNGEETFSDWY